MVASFSGLRCHDYNALLALALWDFARMVRRHRTLN